MLRLACALTWPLVAACVANPAPLVDAQDPANPEAPGAGGTPARLAADVSPRVADDDDATPSDADGDGDGIVDAKDACPEEPELRNGVDDDDGCPETGAMGIRLERSGAKLAFDGTIYFRTNAGDVLPESDKLVAALAQTLRDNPHLGVIRVEVHSDSLGSAEYNLQLTKHRAKALCDALVQLGVDPARLRAAGMGESTPLHCEGDKPPHCSRRVELWIEARAPGRPALAPGQGPQIAAEPSSSVSPSAAGTPRSADAADPPKRSPSKGALRPIAPPPNR